MSRLNAKELWRTASCALLVSLAIPGPVAAQAANATADCNPAPYRFLRYSEDFIFVRNPACQTDFWDAVKHVPFGPDNEQSLSLGGDLRIQWVNARYLSFGNEGGDNHNVFLERIHFHASTRLASALRVFAELKSNFEQNREPGPLGADEDRLDIHQAFVDFGTDRSPQLRLGRQELIYGSGRRIFPRNGPNVRGNFDAVRGMMPIVDWRVDAFVFRPVSVDPGVFDDSTVDTQTFWGLYATGAPSASSPWGLDVYYIGARRLGARFSQGAATEQRHSIGARLFGKSGAWDFDHELTAQGGSFGSGSIKAWALQSETGHSWAAAPFKPRASLRLTVGSGDRDPADLDLQTFNTLFTRGGAVTENFNIAAPNVMHARAGIDMQVAPSLTAVVALETTWRTSRRDAVYGPGGNVIRAPAGSLARHVGDDIEGTVIWRIDRHAAFSFALGYFFSGRFIAESGPDRDMSFATVTFFYRF